MIEVTPRYLAQLRQKLMRYFSAEELRTLCFDMDIDYSDLSGEGKAAKARELVAYLDRRDRIRELTIICAKSRPSVAWGYTPPPPPKADSHPAMILVIDDEADWRKFWKDALRNEGYHLEFATTAGEAYDRLREMSFDLVVTNLLLRDSFTTGWLAESTLILDQIADHTNLRVIIVTGTNERDSEVMYHLLDLQREYTQIRYILFKRRCTAADVRRTVRLLLTDAP